MELNKYQKSALRTADKLEDDELILNGVMGLNGEAGECIDIVKKALFQGHLLDDEKLLDELGDVLWYVAITAEGIGATLDEVAQHNIDKLNKRYPEGFDIQHSVNREF
ncbi:nucleoside triphosphate pyrophosphohydrolase family protein [Aminipila luticellarii]|uniref:Nucleotide pyrophosphohydrolase n=1 Tax=Aminipila luticellarii TaxID=2507160 RepID=A0A410PWY9_9FIRM|nr:nucleoside triphosphate pyrophosphohydrolase family protein [Aminipila luticellarii]QAT43463.1 nucleotide pyrophosphohydrolase [Aminipila luticellarii]